MPKKGQSTNIFGMLYMPRASYVLPEYHALIHQAGKEHESVAKQMHKEEMNIDYSSAVVSPRQPQRPLPDYLRAALGLFPRAIPAKAEKAPVSVVGKGNSVGV